jgi:hypothetical protein
MEVAYVVTSEVEVTVFTLAVTVLVTSTVEVLWD